MAECEKITVQERLKDAAKSLGIPRLIIFGFLALLFVAALFLKLDIASLFSNVLTRLGMNGILVLAMVPTMQVGMGPNFGLPLGITCGLVAATLAIELNLVGWTAFVFALGVAIPLGGLAGYAYGLLLNKLKGEEMTVGTYFGFSIVSLMSIFWAMAPYKSPEMIWPYGGSGLRVTISLAGRYDKILDKFMSFSIGGIVIPTGLLLFFALCCFLMWVFMRTRTGIAMTVVGNNARFAESIGLNVNKNRLLGSTISGALGAVGIIIYSQSYGFLQLYQAPLFMAFFAVGSILIGGASINHALIRHVVIGTFLFQALLVTSLPVANLLVSENLSEVIRIIISNGIILYALSRKEQGGEAK
ncbi:ABC transporter permease [Synergistaceae bacterium OttesenSCG-928-D05]|nr:ABC transporter permease [Synergistaceae bacterium OttesenSCG-928-D05]